MEPFLYRCVFERQADRYQTCSMAWGLKLGNDATLVKAARYDALGSHHHCTYAMWRLVRQHRLESFKLLWDNDYWDPSVLWPTVRAQREAEAAARLLRQSAPQPPWRKALKERKERHEASPVVQLFEEVCKPESYYFRKHVLEQPCRTQHYMGQPIADICLPTWFEDRMLT